MSRANAVKKFGFSRASGFEDFRDRLMEQLAVGSEKILGVSIAKSDLCIEIGRLLGKRCYWDHGVSCSGLST